MPGLDKEAKREIRNRKKWFQRSDVSRHIAKIGDADYRFVRYLKPLGDMPIALLAIREDGYLPDYEVAKEVVYRVSYYNNIMRFAARDKLGMKEIVKRPIKLMERLEKSIKRYFGSDIHQSHELYKELSLILHLSEVMQQNQVTFNDMFKEICSIAKEQDRDLILTENRFNRVYDIFLDWHTLLFQEQKMQLLVHPYWPVAMRYVKDDKKAKELYKMLKIFYTEKRKNTLENFLEGVVDKQYGDISSLSYSPEHLKRFRALKEREGTEGFKLEVAPKILNP
ncbi:hypothetical protein [Rossellomorea marisflavi]|uniref:hypothetical protein n=1 Tax=Rossellomorea marisflavi TaxID=189381 RepID=UPI00345908E7